MSRSRKLSTRLTLLVTISASLPTGLLATQAAAEDDLQLLDPIVVYGAQASYFEDENLTALKGEAADNETPYVVSSTNDVFMTDINATNLEEIFSYTTGVNRAAKSADGFVIRGFDIDLNNIKVDGMSGLITRFGSPSTANIESVEVLKGPASVLYGNMEPGGMVNIVTKKPQREFSASIKTIVESYASTNSSLGEDMGINGTMDVTGPVAGRDDLFYRMIVTGSSLDSFRNNIENQEFNIYGTLLWELNDANRLTLGIEGGKQLGDADDGLAVVNYDINNRASVDTVYQNDGDYDNDEGLALTAEYQHDLEDGQFNLKWRSLWHEDERNLYENNGVSGSTLTRRRRHQKNTRDWHGFDTYLNHGLLTGNIAHDITVGIAGEYRMTDFNRVTWGGKDTVNIYNPVLGGTVAPSEGNRRKTEYYSLGFYAQEKATLTDDLTVVLAARQNETYIDYTCLRGSCNADNSARTSDTVGSLGVIYRLTDSWAAFGNIAQSFDPYTAERVDINGNPLEAEKSQQYEVGLKYGLGETVNATVSLYQIYKDNVAQSLGGGAYETIGKVESQGIELDLQWQPIENWQIKAGYAYNKSEATEGANAGLTPAHAPRNTAFLFTRYNLPKPVWDGELGLTLGLTYRDSVKTDISESDAVVLPAYFLTDAGIHYEKNQWAASLTVSNLFDETYFYAGSDDTSIYVGDPRKIAFTVTRSF